MYIDNSFLLAASNESGVAKFKTQNADNILGGSSNKMEIIM